MESQRIARIRRFIIKRIKNNIKGRIQSKIWAVLKPKFRTFAGPIIRRLVQKTGIRWVIRLGFKVTGVKLVSKSTKTATKQAAKISSKLGGTKAAQAASKLGTKLAETKAAQAASKLGTKLAGTKAAVKAVVKSGISKTGTIATNAATKLSTQLHATGAKVAQTAAQTAAKLGTKIAGTKAAQTAAKVGAKIAGTKVAQATARLGTKLAGTVAVKAVAKVGAKAGAIAAKAAAKLASKSAFKASLGPVGAVLLAFDVLSMGLDIGDAGGYMKMGTIQEYLAMKKGIDKEIKQALEEEGGIFPAVIGPLDKLNDTEFETLVLNTLNELLESDNGSSILNNLFSKLDVDIESGRLTNDSLDNITRLELYAELVNAEDVFEYLCISANGIVVDTGNNVTHCSYRDKQACENSYSWPMNSSEEVYADYRIGMYGGACIVNSYALRTICDGNHIPYNPETGICMINETYCKMKGADWGYSEDINQEDCILNTAQSIAEGIFGTTIVRGLKQLFDPAQYEKCKPGEIDDGYFCRSIFCGPGQEQWASAGICYPKCKEGYHPFGCCICSPDCPEGWTDDGATCRRAGYCPEDKDHDGALCYDKCKDGYYGVGPVCWQSCPSNYTDIGAFCSKGGAISVKSSRVADKKDCPPDMRDDGTSCWKDAYGRGVGRIPDQKPCPEGLRDDGISCWKDIYGRGVGRFPDKEDCPSGMRDDGISCWIDLHIYGKGCCCTWWGCCSKCPKGYADDGCTCRRRNWGIKRTLFDRQVCKSDEEKCLALCYPKCKAGYHRVGCNICAPDEGAGIKLTAFDRYKCNDDEQLWGALCYPKCKTGYRPAGCCLCEPPGGAGIKLTLFDRSYCRPDEKHVLGFCWTKCPGGYSDDGATCRVPLDLFAKKTYGRGVGDPDTKIVGKAPPYGRGVGVPAVHIRAKKRAVPFSSKSNK